MRTFAFISLAVFCFCISSCREISKSPAAIDTLAERQLHALLQEKEYFKLRTLLIKRQDGISEQKKNYFTAFVENAFNHTSRSSELVDQLLKDPENSLSDSSKAELLLLQRDNYIKSFDYAKAAESGKQLLHDYKHVYDESQLHHIENIQKIYEGLSSTPAQKVVLREKTVIEWKKDKVGLINIPIKTNASTYDFIFDTRASISTIMRSYAEKLKLRLLDVKYEESSGITGRTFESQLGIADSLYVGKLMIRNVVFQVLPDSILSFPLLDYEIRGLIGFPVIKELKELRINQNGKITVSIHPSNSSLHNLAFDESTTVVSFRTNKDTLSYHFDTGATSSQLYDNYFKKYESEVKRTGKLESIHIGGAGGLEKREVYHLPSYVLYVDGKMATFKDMQVLTRPSYPNQKYYGNFGQDLITQFQEMILNFENMYVEFK